MYKASYIKHDLIFNVPSGTSRGVLTEKESWFIRIAEAGIPETVGIGECSLIPGLSLDKRENIEIRLDDICDKLNKGEMPDTDDFHGYPALQFAFETALQDLQSGARNILFSSDFTEGSKGIPINGLIWMGSKQSMQEQVTHKIAQGYRILKLKVGAIEFSEELEILRSIRESHSADELEIRLDANGAWKADDALANLSALSKYAIHSIEQPIASGQRAAMAEICQRSPIDIALDEELIGVSGKDEKEQMVSSIDPAYIILKPTLLGGLRAAEEWIQAAESKNIGWWVTSALESNIGLNAIAQWTATLGTTMPQGLGTGQLFTNNIQSPLRIIKDKLFYNPEEQWDISEIKKI